MPINDRCYFHTGHSQFKCDGQHSVELECGAVAEGLPQLPFHSHLIEPDMQISAITISMKLSGRKRGRFIMNH